MVTETTSLPLLGKFPAWVALLYGLLAITVPFLPASSWRSSSFQPTMWVVLLGLVIVSTAYFCFRARAYAFWLLFALFLVQTVEYFSQDFVFTLVGPLPALRFGWGWYSPPVHVNINFLAVFICLLCFRVARSLTIRSSGPLPVGLS
jgi:hypothetical protein